MFPQQVGLTNGVPAIFYYVGVVLLLLAVPGLTLVDAGFSRRKNSLDVWLQRIGMAMIAMLGFAVVGYGVWNWQFYSALGIPHPLGQAISDSWIFGTNLRDFAVHLDPKLVPQGDVFQIFALFDGLAAALVVLFVAGGALERAKPSAMFVLSFVVGAIWVPIAMYLTWGPTGPFSNRGVHDFVGIFFIYIFSGAWALVLAWRLGPRLGRFRRHESTSGPVAHNMNLVALGVMLLLVSIAGFVPGCGFLIPGQGYFGIHDTTSGLGVVIYNLFLAFGFGGLGGVVAWSRLRNPIWVLVGPVCGYIASSAMLDIASPETVAGISFFAPFVAAGAYSLTIRMKIDDPKVGPINLGVGIYGALATGFVGWGVKAGGYPGGVAGYGFQHATINPGTQALGTLLFVLFSFGSAFVTIVAIEKTMGLRVSEAAELRGLDETQWAMPAYGEDELPVLPQPTPVPAGAASEPV